MPKRRPLTRRVEAAMRDIDTLRHQLTWLEANLGDLDVIAQSRQHDDTELVKTRHQHSTRSPDLSAMGHVRLRGQVGTAIRDLQKATVAITAARVALEAHYGGPGANLELIGTLLEPGELDAARRAQARRQANEGDHRWGEWEARGPAQTGVTLKGKP